MNDRMHIYINAYSIYVNKYTIFQTKQRVNRIMIYSKNSWKILEYFLRHISVKLNVNQVGRTLGISVGSAHVILLELAKEGIVTSERWGNQTFYQINLKNRIAQKLCGILYLSHKNEMIKGSEHLQEIDTATQKLDGKVEAVVLHGTGLNQKTGKVKALIILSHKDEAYRLADLGGAISKVDAKTMSLDEFREKVRKNDEETITILEEGMVVLGEDNLVRALIRDA